MKKPSTDFGSSFLLFSSGTCTYAQHPKIRMWATDGLFFRNSSWGVLPSDTAFVGSLFKISWAYFTAKVQYALGSLESNTMVRTISSTVLLSRYAPPFSCGVFAFVTSWCIPLVFSHRCIYNINKICLVTSLYISLIGNYVYSYYFLVPSQLPKTSKWLEIQSWSCNIRSIG